jgi:hypothetical protein
MRWSQWKRSQPLTIGNNVLRVRVQGAQERLVAAIATA